jgi:hypothetical protein
MTTVAEFLNVNKQARLSFTFRGAEFHYQPAPRGEGGFIWTLWADGTRRVDDGQRGLEQALAVLLSRSFRKGVSRQEREEVIKAARAALR